MRWQEHELEEVNLMRDRLVDLINEAKDEYPTIPSVNCCKPTFAYYLADRLIENGVIVPPCKVGDTVYVLFGEPSHTIKEFRVRTIVFGETHDSIGFTNKSLFTIWDKRWYDYFGKTVFLPREEAEQALKGEHHAEIH